MEAIWALFAAFDGFKCAIYLILDSSQRSEAARKAPSAHFLPPAHAALRRTLQSRTWVFLDQIEQSICQTHHVPSIWPIVQAELRTTEGAAAVAAAVAAADNFFRHSNNGAPSETAMGTWGTHCRCVEGQQSWPAAPNSSDSPGPKFGG